MASGILGEADLLANTSTKLYTVPADSVTTLTVSFCNRTASVVKVRLLAPMVEGTTSTYFEYDASIPVNGVLERTGIVLNAGRNLTVQSDKAGVTAIAHGFEEEV
ncbi:hypothetical protein [Pseudomonas helleri]|uniref:hypothetical protein n=1 Tax=Pseudomonas helleri TaxID=1608996 RepID=UPI003F945710